MSDGTSDGDRRYADRLGVVFVPGPDGTLAAVPAGEMVWHMPEGGVELAAFLPDDAASAARFDETQHRLPDRQEGLRDIVLSVWANDDDTCAYRVDHTDPETGGSAPVLVGDGFRAPDGLDLNGDDLVVALLAYLAQRVEERRHELSDHQRDWLDADPDALDRAAQEVGSRRPGRDPGPATGVGGGASPGRVGGARQPTAGGGRPPVAPSSGTAGGVRQPAPLGLASASDGTVRAFDPDHVIFTGPPDPSVAAVALLDVDRDETPEEAADRACAPFLDDPVREWEADGYRLQVWAAGGSDPATGGARVAYLLSEYREGGVWTPAALVCDAGLIPGCRIDSEDAVADILGHESARTHASDGWESGRTPRNVAWTAEHGGRLAAAAQHTLSAVPPGGWADPDLDAGQEQQQDDPSGVPTWGERSDGGDPPPPRYDPSDPHLDGRVKTDPDGLRAVPFRGHDGRAEEYVANPDAGGWAVRPRGAGGAWGAATLGDVLAAAHPDDLDDVMSATRDLAETLESDYDDWGSAGALREDLDEVLDSVGLL